MSLRQGGELQVVGKSRVFHSIQALRGFAALMVVLFHLRIVEGRFGAGEALLPGALRFADAGVDLFFVISGFVMTTIAAGRYGSANEAGRFLVRRAWRILPPYWLYTTLVVALMLLAPGLANSSYGEQSILASYLLWPQEALPVLTVGWTLIHEAYFYLAMAIAIAILRESHLPWFLLGWAVVTLSMYGAVGAPPPWLAVLSSPMTLEFIAGAFIGLYWRRLPRSLSLAALVTGMVLLLSGMVAANAAALSNHTPVLRVLAFGLPGALIVLGAASFEGMRSIRMPRWSSELGNSSFSLYLGHVFVISAAGRLWQASGHNTGAWQYAAFLVLAVVACVAGGWLSYRWIESPLQSFGATFFARSRLASQAA